MAILFVGGEDIDFTGSFAISTTTSHRRTAYARCAISLDYNNTSATSTFSQSVSEFWFTARCYMGSYSTTVPLMIFSDNGASCLALMYYASGTFRACKYNSGSLVALADSTNAGTLSSTLFKLDINIKFGASGFFRVYRDGIEVLNYTGDTSSGSSTTINGFTLRGSSSSFDNRFSEMIASTGDTRALSLVTHVPTANGAYVDWSGGYADVDETLINDTDLLSSGTPDQVESFQIGDLPTTNIGVRALCIKTRAARDSEGTGPSKLQFGVNSGGTLGFDPSEIAVPAGLSTISTVMEINPVTGVAFTPAEINAMEIAIKSRS